MRGEVEGRAEEQAHRCVLPTCNLLEGGGRHGLELALPEVVELQRQQASHIDEELIQIELMTTGEVSRVGRVR